MRLLTLPRILLLLALSMNSVNVNAANLYRFNDQNGVVTMSKSLPPYAAQQGYDILDANSLRLIKKVPPALTPEQIRQKQAEAKKQQEEKNNQAKAREIEKEKRRQQKVIDQNLVARFSSEAELEEAREQELNFYQILLKTAEENLNISQNKLLKLQTQAGKLELSGQGVNDNLKNKIAQVHDEINSLNRNIKEIELDIENMKANYAQGLIRLRYLLSNQTD